MNGDIYHAMFCLQIENLLDIVAVVDEVLIKTSDVWTVSYNTGCTTILLKLIWMLSQSFSCIVHLNFKMIIFYCKT